MAALPWALSTPGKHTGIRLLVCRNLRRRGSTPRYSACQHKDCNDHCECSLHFHLLVIGGWLRISSRHLDALRGQLLARKPVYTVAGRPRIEAASRTMLDGLFIEITRSPQSLQARAECVEPSFQCTARGAEYCLPKGFEIRCITYVMSPIVFSCNWTWSRHAGRIETPVRLLTQRYTLRIVLPLHTQVTHRFRRLPCFTQPGERHPSARSAHHHVLEHVSWSVPFRPNGRILDTRQLRILTTTMVVRIEVIDHRQHR